MSMEHPIHPTFSDHGSLEAHRKAFHQVMDPKELLVAELLLSQHFYLHLECLQDPGWQPGKVAVVSALSHL